MNFGSGTTVCAHCRFRRIFLMFETLVWTSSGSKVPKIIQISYDLYKNSKAIVSYCLDKIDQSSKQVQPIREQVQSVIQNLVDIDSIKIGQIYSALNNLILDEDLHCYLVVGNCLHAKF